MRIPGYRSEAHGVVQDTVVVEEKDEDRMTVFELHVAQEDMGKVIGKQGRIAKALRTVVKAAATRENKRVTVEII